MTDRCEKCGGQRSPQYGEERIVYGAGLDPLDVCHGPEFISCRIRAAGRRIGRREGAGLAKNVVGERAQTIANIQGGHLVNGVVLCGELQTAIYAALERLEE